MIQNRRYLWYQARTTTPICHRFPARQVYCYIIDDRILNEPLAGPSCVLPTHTIDDPLRSPPDFFPTLNIANTISYEPTLPSPSGIAAAHTHNVDNLNSNDDWIRLRAENVELRRQISEKDATIANLMAKLVGVSEVFTDGQILKLQNPLRRLHWSQENLATSTAIHSAGPRAYHLLFKKNLFPSVSTLRKSCAKVQMRPGSLHSVGILGYCATSQYAAAAKIMCFIL